MSDNPPPEAPKPKPKPRQGKRERKHDALKRAYGIGIEHYDAMLSVQKHRCAICGTPPKKGERALAVDHCHKSGYVRGLLYIKCNLGIGSFRDDPALCVKAAEYIQSPPFRGGGK